jgi:high affinity Mn2+ porin
MRVFIFIGLTLLAAAAHCQEQTGNPSEEATTMFAHPEDTWWWVSGQTNVVFQAHPSFPARYSGPLSMKSSAEQATSEVFTLYTGAQLSPTTEILVDVESAGGRGISDALGLAGFTNLDVVRNPDLGRAPYIALGIFHQIIPLGSHREKNEDRGPLGTLKEIPVRRLDFRFGKMGTADFFDINPVGSDSHLQFLNWTVDNNGAYDYAADTRGYTVGAMLEYSDVSWSLRFGEFLMPTIANGIDYDWNLRRSRAENVEFELRKSLLPKRKAAWRVLSFVNHANMGTYRDAIARFLAGIDPRPDITLTRKPGTIKYGFGFNVEQDLSEAIRVFGRLGWNEGQHETFAYTEVDQTVELGGDVSGRAWKRKFDRAGVAFVSNGISKDHADYLRLGGQGFLLGDGTLNYGRETIEEAYYTAHIWRGVFVAFDLQHINNPGYNRDRGPLVVPGLRLHIDY